MSAWHQAGAGGAFNMTRTLAISTAAALAFLTGSLVAHAADLPQTPAYKEPAVFVPAFTWTGFYLGGELGWMQTMPTYTPGAVIAGAPFVASSLPVSDKHGVTYGLITGYNYQVGQVVLGFEGDITGWTVGESRFTAITGDFITAQMGRLDPRTARLRRRPRSVLRDGRRGLRLHQDVGHRHGLLDRRRRHPLGLDARWRH
jgi:hypothetical protein